jgi:predicted DNA-binding transcriptional regulator AlpA
MNIPNHPLLTVKEFCAVARIANSTAYKLMNEGTVESLKVSGATRIKAASVAKMLGVEKLSDLA